MADEKASTEMLRSKRTFEVGRKVMVGTDSNYSGPVDTKVNANPKIKAIWRNETGEYDCMSFER